MNQVQLSTMTNRVTSLPRVKKQHLSFRRASIVVIFIVVLVIIWAHLWVEYSSRRFIYDNSEICPGAPVAVVLGVARNKNYEPRLHTASELFFKGKVRAILVSGDNSRQDYDEPGAMKRDLVALGVPAEYVACDYAGLRTLDSVLRAVKVFGQPHFIVVSQRYHCKRAIFLARYHGLDVIGVSASKGEGYGSERDRLRELFARTKALWDAVFDVQPRFLGRPEVVYCGTKSMIDARD